MMKEELKHIIESLLFVSETPLSVQKIKTILDLRDTTVIDEVLNTLSQEYEKRKGGFYLSQVAGGYQLRTRAEYKEWIKRMLQNRPARLSKAAMETLAIIAYKQPIIRSDIEYIRGVDCGGVLRVLLERKIIRVMGRKEIPGRPMIYATTSKFLEMFNLKDLKDLPTPKEIEELNKDEFEQLPEFNIYKTSGYLKNYGDIKVQKSTQIKWVVSRYALRYRNYIKFFKKIKKLSRLNNFSAQKSRRQHRLNPKSLIKQHGRAKRTSRRIRRMVRKIRF